MDEDTLARAIDPFFTTKDVGKGTGLGLSMVQGLAAQSGGRLLLRSRVGKGTTATLYLPVADRPDRVPIAPQPVLPVAGVRRSILVVDDDALVLANTAAMLEDLGHDVALAISAKDALDQLEHDAGFDLIISDQLMPDMTGFQLIEIVRARWPGIATLIVSGFAQLAPEEARKARILAKPFTQTALAEAVQESIASASVIPIRRQHS
jgi:CheY-like chemotaxis protein